MDMYPHELYIYIHRAWGRKFLGGKSEGCRVGGGGVYVNIIFLYSLRQEVHSSFYDGRSLKNIKISRSKKKHIYTYIYMYI